MHSANYTGAKHPPYRTLYRWRPNKDIKSSNNNRIHVSTSPIVRFSQLRSWHYVCLLTHFVFFEHLTYWLLTNMLASGFLFDQIKSKVVSRLVGNWGGKSFLFSAKIQNTKKYHRKYANTDLQICWKSDVKEFFFSAKILSPWCAALHLTHSAKASKPTNFLRAGEIKPSEGADHSQTTRNFNIISRFKKNNSESQEFERKYSKCFWLSSAESRIEPNLCKGWRSQIQLKMTFIKCGPKARIVLSGKSFWRRK